MRNSPILIVSGATGASGAQIVRTALAQFENADLPIEVVPHARTEADLSAVVERAAREGGLIVHTLVDPKLRDLLVEMAHKNHVVALDLMGPLLHHLTHLIGEPPLGEPGRYRETRKQELRRIDAIEFTVEHDDGQRVRDLPLAEVVVIGVSRVGKTPVSMYLATLGWKVANVPLAREIEPPAELFAVDYRRVVGLRIEPGQLIQHRRHRQQRLGFSNLATYAVATELVDELAYAETVCRKGRFQQIDITDKPIEETADEIIASVRRRLA